MVVAFHHYPHNVKYGGASFLGLHIYNAGILQKFVHKIGYHAEINQLHVHVIKHVSNT